MRKKTITTGFGVTMQPKTYQGMLRGIDFLAEAIRPTLGPFPRLVATATIDSSRSPELLDDGGTIARRMIQLPDRDEDIGAMYLRHLLWRVREDCGDGAATAAVLFSEVIHQGVRHIVDGGHAMLLRASLEKGARLVYDEIGRLARPVSDPSTLEHISASICADAEMARMLGEIFRTIGEFGHLELRSGNSRGLETEYVEGSFWEGNLHARVMLNLPLENRACFENAAVLVTDFSIEDPMHLVRMITAAKKAEKNCLMLICNSISESCTGFLMSETTRAVLPVFAVKTPSKRLEEQIAAMEDIAVLTGAKPLTLHAGETLETVTPAHFGEARSVWSKDQFFGILGGQGSPRAIRQHFWTLKKLHASLEAGEMKDLVRSRIGKLLGGSAILWVGGTTETEIAYRKDLAGRAVDAIRGAMMKGVVPGGGMALLACKPALQTALAGAQTAADSAAYRILLNAMDVPLRVIAANAGLKPDEVMAEIKYAAGPGFGYDVRKQKPVAWAQTEILDPTDVVQTVAYRSISAAALLLTVDVLVRHQKPETVVDT